METFEALTLKGFIIFLWNIVDVPYLAMPANVCRIFFFTINFVL